MNLNGWTYRYSFQKRYYSFDPGTNLFYYHNLDRLFIGFLYVSGARAKVRFDTSSEVSKVSAGFLKKVGIMSPVWSRVSEKPVQIKNGNGTNPDQLPRPDKQPFVYLEVYLVDESLSDEFLVVPQISSNEESTKDEEFDVSIGISFLHQYGGGVDFKKMVVRALKSIKIIYKGICQIIKVSPKIRKLGLLELYQLLIKI